MKALIKQLVGKAPVRTYHVVKGELASILARRPAQQMCTIGVTGTNGKTTVVNLIARIFEEAGFKVALLSTIQFRINGKEWPNELKMTVPDARVLNRFLTDAKKAGCQILVLEATSIALDQNRLAGITFDTGVLTNITHDHLDYHGTFDTYVQAKRQLFARGLRVSVVNADDPNGRAFAQENATLHFLYSLDASATDCVRATKIREEGGWYQFDCILPDTAKIHIKTHLAGTFNQSNILAAVCVGLAHGISPQIMQKAIAGLDKVPGRMELVSCGQPFKVIVDYAHTPDALQKMYDVLKPVPNGGHVLSVLGSCGDRDKTKRPKLGKIAGQEAQNVFVTNEDPYTEDPHKIIDAVASGIKTGNSKHVEGETYWRVFDRREAIAKAFARAKPGDIVTITGKGAETAMVWGSEFRPWSDVAVAQEELKKLGYSTESKVDGK